MGRRRDRRGRSGRCRAGAPGARRRGGPAAGRPARATAPGAGRRRRQRGLGGAAGPAGLRGHRGRQQPQRAGRPAAAGPRRRRARAGHRRCRATWTRWPRRPRPTAPTWCSGTGCWRWSTTPRPRWPRCGRPPHPGRRCRCWSPGRYAAVLGRALGGRLAEARALLTDPDGRFGPHDALRRRLDVATLRALLESGGLRVELLQGDGVLEGWVPGSVRDGGPAAAAPSPSWRSWPPRRQPLRDVAARLHALARRPAGRLTGVPRPVRGWPGPRRGPVATPTSWRPAEQPADRPGNSGSNSTNVTTSRRGSRAVRRARHRAFGCRVTARPSPLRRRSHPSRALLRPKSTSPLDESG